MAAMIPYIEVAHRALAFVPNIKIMNVSNDPVARRRTFAIISHPDAGKTTLTEKLLLFGGAIQMAGAVKARGAQRRAHSDWMKVERAAEEYRFYLLSRRRG